MSNDDQKGRDTMKYQHHVDNFKEMLLELELYYNRECVDLANQPYTAGKSSESVLRHELGHAIHHQLQDKTKHLDKHESNATAAWDALYDRRRKQAEQLSNRFHFGGKENVKKYFQFAKTGEGVSVYGGSDSCELFAEAWTIYSHPLYGKSVKQLPDDIHTFFTQYLPRRKEAN